MLLRLNNLNVKNKRISAVDGNNINEIKNKFFIGETKSYNSNKEYSTILSHLKALEKYKNYDNIKYGIAMICEDDLSLDFYEYWDNNLENIINGANNANSDWEIIMLGYFTLDIKFDNNYRKWDNDWSALCYLIKYESLYKLDQMKEDGKYKCFNDIMVADNYIFRIFNTYLYKCPFFTFPENNNSTIHDYHLEYHKLYKEINKIIINKDNINYII